MHFLLWLLLYSGGHNRGQPQISTLCLFIAKFTDPCPRVLDVLWLGHWGQGVATEDRRCLWFTGQNIFIRTLSNVWGLNLGWSCASCTTLDKLFNHGFFCSNVPGTSISDLWIKDNIHSSTPAWSVKMQYTGELLLIMEFT